MSEAFSRRYTLLDRIAIGGTAEVFHAFFHGEDGGKKPVVVKMILPQFARDERFRRLFHEEACVAATISHPNIVRVLDFGDLDQTCYIALERVEGMDLSNLLNRARARNELPPHPLVAFIGSLVGEALQFIHDKTSSEGTPLKIVHRDVSPQNILISFQGEVKLTDFGIAKSTIRRETTVDGTLRGKLSYMAPEQAGLGEMDRCTDLFALGCVLYEMIQGIPPFQGQNEIETLERIRQNRMLVPLSELSTNDQLRQILDRALRPNKEERYANAQAMVADLHTYLNAVEHPPSSEDLGAWAQSLVETPAPGQENAVDDAVRRLLGDSDVESESGSGPKTSIFTGKKEALIQNTNRYSSLRGRSQGSRINTILVVIALTGVLGWFFWAILYFDRHSANTQRQDSGPISSHLPSRPRDQGERRRSEKKLDARPYLKIAITTSPAGAGVWINGVLVGQTPDEFTLPREKFFLELRRIGYRPYSQWIDPATAKPKLRATLSRIPVNHQFGYLSINSIPWSRVKIDGIYVGNTPIKRMQLKAQRHQIELLSPDGKIRKKWTVTIGNGKTIEQGFDFTK